MKAPYRDEIQKDYIINTILKNNIYAGQISFFITVPNLIITSLSIFDANFTYNFRNLNFIPTKNYFAICLDPETGELSLYESNTNNLTYPETSYVILTSNNWNVTTPSVLTNIGQPSFMQEDDCISCKQILSDNFTTYKYQIGEALPTSIDENFVIFYKTNTKEFFLYSQYFYWIKIDIVKILSSFSDFRTGVVRLIDGNVKGKIYKIVNGEEISVFEPIIPIFTKKSDVTFLTNQSNYLIWLLPGCSATYNNTNRVMLAFNINSKLKFELNNIGNLELFTFSTSELYSNLKLKLFIYSKIGKYPNILNSSNFKWETNCNNIVSREGLHSSILLMNFISESFIDFEPDTNYSCVMNNVETSSVISINNRSFECFSESYFSFFVKDLLQNNILYFRNSSSISRTFISYSEDSMQNTSALVNYLSLLEGILVLVSEDTGFIRNIGLPLRFESIRISSI